MALVIRNFTETLLGKINDILLFNSQLENITEAICRQLTEFASPVYLALFDESERLNSDPDLTKLLLNVSVALNSTLEMARYLVSYHKCLVFHPIHPSHLALPNKSMYVCMYVSSVMTRHSLSTIC